LARRDAFGLLRPDADHQNDLHSKVRQMALIRNLSSVSGAIPRNAFYNARRLGALGLVRMASCVLRSASKGRQ
jgi:hypothetical protein